LVGDIVNAYERYEDGKSTPRPIRSRGDR
jgi:hypothetical protein